MDSLNVHTKVLKRIFILETKSQLMTTFNCTKYKHTVCALCITFVHIKLARLSNLSVKIKIAIDPSLQWVKHLSIHKTIKIWYTFPLIKGRIKKKSDD